ncbi:hypothetical protein R5R35_014396 [Gryllus longicercus]|uniref:CRAL-TRIO domain-containing protein n=1 Tax=Gryllus longicercus TaxID=2509291 RepID=A0AAN9V657_9ORTH
MSDNDVIHNDTPTESDKMDISEVSDQATPFSDRSPSEVIDNQEPDANAVVLDNAPAVAAAAAVTTNITTSTTDMSTPLTTDKLLQEKMLQATNVTSNLTTSKPIGVTSTTMANDKDSLSGKEQDLGNWSSAGEDTTLSREHSESKLSLEGLDLELPTLEMYQEEFVDFPSSPTHENFQPQLLVGERDSGNAGGSEEEEEDTSIYRAVLSPNCQDVRLRKEVAVGVASMVDIPATTSAIFNNNSIATCISSTLTAAITDVPLTTTTTVTANVANTNVTAATSSVDSNEDDKNRSQRKVLSPNPEDTQLPDIGGIPVTVIETTEELPRSTAFHKSMESLSGMKTILSTPVVDDGSGDESNSDFVFERRDSKRLSRYALGERVMEGLFVESRNKDSGANSGLRKISVPDEVMNSPESDSKDLDLSFESSDNLNGEIAKKQPLVRKFPPLGPTNSDPGPGKPVPAARSKSILWDSGTDYSKMTSPPCPKPRRKNRTAVPAESFKHETKGPQLLLNPLTLDSQTPIRRVAKVNPDGTVEVEERPGSLISSQRGGRRRIRVTADILSGHAREDEDDDPEDGDASSIGGHSSRLSDADLLSPGEDDADLDALLSPGVDTPDELEDSILERLGEPPPMTTPAAAPIPELTAAEERVESRNWRSCVVQGIERRIDMKVIEPYKRVLSHGGYLTAGSHNAIIVFSACFLPDRSRVDYDYVMDNLFLYVLTTLDQLITEDYVLIYLHGATQRSCMPTFTWLKRCYQLIDRRLRKNLKGLYLVHPTFWLKTIVLMTKPFISSKFSRKLRFVDNLAELAAIVPLEQASIPDRVKQLDDELEERAVKRRSLLNWWWTQTPDTTTVSS